MGGSRPNVLLLYAIVAGLLIGRLLGGRVRDLEHVHIAWWPLALGGLAVQAVLFADPVAQHVGTEGRSIYVVSTLIVLAALLRNVGLPGLAIIAGGAFLNLLPVLANGGAMPSSPDAWLAVTGVAQVPVEGFSNVVLSGPQTLFPFLGDIFVWPQPLPFATVFSIGDAVIALGGIVFLVTGMLPAGRRWVGPGRTAPAPTLR
jgi:hypothetical protein